MRVEEEPPEVPSEYTPRALTGPHPADTACGAACGARAKPESRVLSLEAISLVPFSYESTKRPWWPSNPNGDRRQWTWMSAGRLCGLCSQWPGCCSAPALLWLPCYCGSLLFTRLTRDSAVCVLSSSVTSGIELSCMCCCCAREVAFWYSLGPPSHGSPALKPAALGTACGPDLPEFL